MDAAINVIGGLLVLVLMILKQDGFGMGAVIRMSEIMVLIRCVVF